MTPQLRHIQPLQWQRVSMACVAALAGLFCVNPSAWAQDSDAALKFSGFGTLGVAYHDREGVQYRRDISQRTGANAGNASADVDSMLGLQATWDINPHWQTMLQVVSRQNVDAGYQPQVTWGYAKFSPNESFSARAGRLGIEMYLQGDTAEIGYANLPVRQPVIFYPRTMNGMDAELLQPLGSGTLRIKGMIGEVLGKLPSAGTTYDTSGSKIRGALIEYLHGPWTGRFGTGSLTLRDELPLNNDLQSLLYALTMVPNGGQIRSSIAMQERTLQYTTLAASYDSGPLQGLASYSTIDSALWPRTKMFYAIAGYRIGALTPYAVYAQTHTDREVIATGIPAGASPLTDRIAEASAQAQGGSRVNQTSVALGLRHDLSRNLALKLQVDAIRYQDPGNIRDDSLATRPYANWEYKDLRVFSAALEFIF